MAKKNHEKSEKSEKSEKIADPQIPAASAATLTPEKKEDTPMADDTNTETALATAEQSTALGTTNESLTRKKEWAAKLTHKRVDILSMDDRPSPEGLFDTVLALPDAFQNKMLEVVKKANPKKQGAHSSRTGFSPIQIRLFQGTGNDPVRPKNMPPGQFYTADSRILGDKFNGAVIGFYEGRIMWPLRDQGGNSGGSNAPLCYSLDRKMGSRYGECAQCPNASKPYNQGGCAREVVVYLIDEDMTGVYETRFSKSSQGAGEALTKILAKSENIWDRWVTFEAVERSEGQKRWYVQKATPVSDSKKPENNVTPKQLGDLFRSLSLVIDYDVYFPTLADIYDRSKTSSDSNLAGGGSAAGETIDEKSFLGNAASDSDNPDYGSDTPNV